MSFFSSLLGKKSASEATALGQRNAGQINTGFDQANQAATTGYETSQNRLMPFAQAGQRGHQMYSDALGVNGADARLGAFQTFESDPFRQFASQNSGREVGNIFRRYNAQGQGNSGASMLAVSRAAGERAQGDVNNWLNRMSQFGNQGLEVTGQQIGLDQGYYGGQADRAIGRSTALANNDTQATMAANNARQAGVNNLLNVFGTVAGVAARRFGVPPVPGTGG